MTPPRFAPGLAIRDKPGLARIVHVRKPEGLNP
jgi:hypothetical protein